MGRFKNILSQFIEIDDATKNETSNSTVINQPISPTVISQQTNTINQDVINYVNESIYKNIIHPSFIFHSLDNIVNNLKQSGLSDDTAYSSAFLALKSTNPNLTKKDIVNSIRDYSDVLKKNSQSINDKCIELENNELKTAVANNNSLRSKIKETEQLLIELNQKLNQGEQDLLEIESSINEIKNALMLATTNYTTDLSNKLNKIETLIQY